MIQTTRFSHAVFETPDIDRQIDYFTEVVGLQLSEKQNGRAFLATKLGDLVVQLEKGRVPRCAKLAFQAAPGTDIAEIKRGVEAENIACELRNDATPGVPKLVTFKDPKDTVIEVFADQTPIGKNQQVRGIGPIKLGHLAFVVDDPKKYVEFYTRVLGFRVSDWIQDWFAFMRCGPDHHTINFVRGKSIKMHHIAFELKDWAHVQNACDFLGSRNIPLIWGPGRHGPGHNIYTYHRNPDDQITELFTELDKMLDEKLGYFDPRPWHRDRPQKPKVWEGARDIWGLPPSPEYMRQRD
jgi:catechol 2,3-dioxygenase-like lactoylglutathione lyase family enzyme